MPELIRKKKKMSSFEMIAFGFAGVILLGAIILMLPISSSAGVVTPFDKTLFTATSAVCVTGLVVVDTGSYWSLFGQGIILLLIQIGGMGIITIAITIAVISGRKIGWIGSHHCGCIFFNGFREKDLVNAAEYDAGCDFSTESRWNCPAYEIYSTGNLSDRTDRCHSHASCILQGLWMERNLDVSLPFGIGFLQCRF